MNLAFAKALCKFNGGFHPPKSERSPPLRKASEGEGGTKISDGNFGARRESRTPVKSLPWIRSAVELLGHFILITGIKSYLGAYPTLRFLGEFLDFAPSQSKIV